MKSANVHVGLPPSPALPASLQTLLLWRRPFAYLEALRDRLGRRFTVHALGRPPLVFLADPADAKGVFGASPDLLRPGVGGATIQPIVGRRSFMLADGDEHQRGRNLLGPLYTDHAVQTHAELVRDIAEREVAAWPCGKPVALHDRFRALSLRVILHTLFGSDLAETPLLHSRLLSMLSMTAGTGLALPATRLLPPGRGTWRRFVHDRQAVDALIFELIERRRGTASGGREALGVLLAARLPDGRPLSRRHIRDNLMSLILAGHETTAAELSWSFQLLAHSDRVRTQLVAELDRDPSSEYLSATVREVLRHRPVFLFAIPRAVCAPVEIGDWTYEPPAHLLVCIYLLHHDPDLFSNPQQFRPERFLGERTGQSWVPWGGGRKRCPGRRLAVLELETVLKVALSAVTIRPAATEPERPRWRSVIVVPEGGCRVILERRGPAIRSSSRARRWRLPQDRSGAMR